ncbi:MBL fold metallo-hydrolase [Aquincola sp. S2]|uniref:MBL fold metallo-hydrolase n=1 Tax=Pseudaquabacterium terrae TaxID=2732868 RepID=A0ABX2EN11_9BURK|nr:MBL fold metallo-hydrolase [Aquabacterium terrae]NRF69879.1 MBL fold metallo-hydrolase [Aquabacterium terrae]
MQARWWAAVAATAMMTAAPVQAQPQDWSKVEIKIEKLSASTYMLTGAGGNLGVSVGDDAVFVVDDQFAPLTAKIQAAIATLSKQPVKFVLNTHWHFDHTGGNENHAKAGAAIVAHANVRKRMSSDQVISFLQMPIKASPKAALPIVTFTSDVSFHLNGDEVQVFHVPNAHTDGDAIVHFRQSNVLHLGDVFFNKLYPFIDTSSGGSVDGVIAAVDKVLAIARDDTQIIPGHGPRASKADLKAYRDMLATVSGRIKEHVRAGRKLEEVVAAKPTAEFDAVWGGGFIPPDRFITMLWGDLKR